ncbi:MAG: zf-HC2 domain-containing protein [Candidatus Eiseniibacteriota bacterium]
MNEDCATFRDSLSAFADGELDAAAAVRVREHLRSCQACRDAVAAYAVADAAVAEIGTWRPEAEWAQLAERIDSAVARQPLPNTGPLASARARKRRLHDRFSARHLSLALGSAGTLLAALLVLLLRPLSDDLAPVDTVPPLGRPAGREAKQRAGQPAEGAQAERSVVAETEAGPASSPPVETATEPEASEEPPPEPAAEPRAQKALDEVSALEETDLAPGTLLSKPAPVSNGAAQPSALDRGVAVGRAGIGRSEAELVRAVDAAEEQLVGRPPAARRAEVLSRLVTLWADLVAIAPGRYCTDAGTAADQWEALALPAPGDAELDAVRRIREACSE